MSKNAHEVYTFTWTQTTTQLDIGNDIAPHSCTVLDPKSPTTPRATTADLAIDVSEAEKIYVQCNTTGPASATNFDYKIISSPDGVAYDSTGNEYLVASTAQAITTIKSAAVTPSPHFIKVRLDVNATNVTAAASVTMKVFVNKR